MPCCIILLAPDTDAPRPLVEGLEQRGVGVDLALNAPQVMRQLATAGALTIIAVEPTRQPHLRELREAVAQYYPRTLMWRYESQSAGGPAALAAMTGPGAAESPAEGPSPSPAAPRRDDDESQAGQLASLTEQELAMLLGDDQSKSASADVP